MFKEGLSQEERITLARLGNRLNWFIKFCVKERPKGLVVTEELTIGELTKALSDFYYEKEGKDSKELEVVREPNIPNPPKMPKVTPRVIEDIEEPIKKKTGKRGRPKKIQIEDIKEPIKEKTGKRGRPKKIQEGGK